MTETSIEIDGALVAQALGLELTEFRKLLDNGKITQLCERGIGEDAGHYRASFYYGKQRARFVVDASGKPVA